MARRGGRRSPQAPGVRRPGPRRVAGRRQLKAQAHREGRREGRDRLGDARGRRRSLGLGAVVGPTVVARKAGAGALESERGRAEAGHPAGVDQVEVGQVRGDVQGDAVERDAASDADPERPDLARERTVGIHPAAGVAGSRAGRDAGGRAGVGHGALQGLDERADAERPQSREPGTGALRREGDDRVRHKLARAVVGDLAAALHADNLDPARRQLLRGRHDVSLAGIAAERQDPVVLEEQKLVLVEGSVRARSGQRLLQGPRVAIRDSTQPAGAQDPGRRLLHLHAVHLCTIPAHASREVAGPRTTRG